MRNNRSTGPSLCKMKAGDSWRLRCRQFAPHRRSERRKISTKFYTGFDSLGHSSGHSSILIRGTELASIGLSRMGDCGLCCKKMGICVAKQGHWQAASLRRENQNLRDLPRCPRPPRCRCDLDALGGSCGLGHGASEPGGAARELAPAGSAWLR